MNAGHVYVVYTTLSRPPKDKLTVCICAAESLFFWINTKPQSHGNGQLELHQTDHGALTHDCYLDCSRVTTFSAHELQTARNRGPISCDLAQRIVAYLNNAPPKTLAPKHLRLAIANLSTLVGQLFA
jgi:hypothetical protein